MTIAVIAVGVVALLAIALARMQRGYFFFVPLKPGVDFNPRVKIEGVAFINYDGRTNLLRVHCYHCYQGVDEKEVVKRLVERGIVREDAKATY